MRHDLIIEACVESLPQALMAEQLGANRIELCGRLDLDGLTPSKDLVIHVLEQLNIPMNVMIRPRDGNFVYTADELGQMLSFIDFCKTLPVNGVVFGMLTARNEPDLDLIAQLAEHSAPLEVTIHKAIDLVTDPVIAVKRLTQIPEVTAVLSSGKAETALEGAGWLRKMIEACEGQITVIAAGRITNENFQTVHQTIGATAYHGRKIVGNLNI